MSINGQLAVTALGCQGSHAPPFQELGKLNELTVLVLSQEWNVDLPVQSIVVLYDSGSNINSVTGKWAICLTAFHWSPMKVQPVE